ncbi:hypothetical protein [Stappia sp. ICDLI1TA098]
MQNNLLYLVRIDALAKPLLVILSLVILVPDLAYSGESKSKCYPFFSKEKSILELYPAIFDIKNGLNTINRAPDDMYTKDKNTNRKTITVLSNLEIYSDSEINFEFQVISIFHPPKIIYKTIPDKSPSGIRIDDANILIVSSRDDLSKNWSELTTRETNMHVSTVPGCRVIRHIRKNRVMRTLVEVNPKQARYQGRSCIRAGILMGLGLNNLEILSGPEYVRTNHEDEYMFLFTKDTGLMQISVPEVSPGMSIDDFEKVRRSLTCED